MTTCIRPAALLSLDWNTIADPRRRDQARDEYRRLGITRSVGTLSTAERRALGWSDRRRPDHGDGDGEHDDDQDEQHDAGQARAAQAGALDEVLLAELPMPTVTDDGIPRDVDYFDGVAYPFDRAIPLGRLKDGQLVAEQLAADSLRGRPRARLSLEHDPRRVLGHVDWHPTADAMAVTGTLVMDAADGKAAAAMVRSGSMVGLSIEFQSNPNADVLEDRGTVAVIHRRSGILTGLSLVSVPAYGDRARITGYYNESPEQHRNRTAELRPTDPRVARLRADMADLQQRAAGARLAEQDRTRRLRGQLVQVQARAARAAAGITP